MRDMFADKIVRFWTVSVKIRHLVLGLALLCGISFNSAQAHLISSLPAQFVCEEGSPAGTTLIGTVKDPAGNIFTLNCISGERGIFFQGSVFEKALNLIYDFGRCLYKA